MIEPGREGDGDAIIGEMAHIIGASRQGPRGDEPLDDAERNKHTNLILLCPTHHTIVDDQLRTYSVAVLRQMKADHEARMATLARKPVPESKPELRNERIQSTLLPVTHLPQAVFAARCAFMQSEESEVKQRIVYPKRLSDNDPHELAPFILRDGKPRFASQGWWATSCVKFRLMKSHSPNTNTTCDVVHRAGCSEAFIYAATVRLVIRHLGEVPAGTG